MGLKREKKRQRRLPGMGDPRQTSNEESAVKIRERKFPRSIYILYIFKYTIYI